VLSVVYFFFLNLFILSIFSVFSVVYKYFLHLFFFLSSVVKKVMGSGKGWVLVPGLVLWLKIFG